MSGINVITPTNHNSGVRPTRARSRQGSGEVIIIEDFRQPTLGMWNDGIGGATRDCDIMFGGMPTLRLDPQGNSAGATTTPGRTAATQGVVCKRRIHDGFTGRFGVEGWFRFTSPNLTSSSFLSMSLYNRDATNAYHARVWLDPNGNNQPLVARILDGAATAAMSGQGTGGTLATYTAVSTSVLQNGAGTHTFDPTTGRMDRAGGWHYTKLVADMATKKYVSLQLDGQPVVDLSSYQMDTTTSTAFAGMHLSFEFCTSTTVTPRFVNIAQVVGTVE